MRLISDRGSNPWPGVMSTTKLLKNAKRIRNDLRSLYSQLGEDQQKLRIEIADAIGALNRTVDYVTQYLNDHPEHTE